MRAIKCLPVFLIAILILANTVTGAEYNSSVKIQKLLDTETTNLGQRIRYPASGPAHIQSLLVELDPGAETGLHQHPILTYGYILEGSIEIRYEGGQSRVYRKGDAFIEAVNTGHNGKNTGKIPAKILVVFISDKSQKQVIRKK